MTHIFIIVEGPSDEVILNEILRFLLPSDTYKLHFYPAGGYYNALTSVRPILDLVSEDSKVLLVFDADTTRLEKVQERIDYVRDHVGADAYSAQFNVFTFIPTIDVVIPKGAELARFKRTQREEYNRLIIQAVNNHIDEIKEIETIKSIVNFITV